MKKHKYLLFEENLVNAIFTLCAFSAKKKYRYLIFMCFFASLALFPHPMDALIIRAMPSGCRENHCTEAPLFKASAPLGKKFETEYIHSVQRTPVQDIYFIVNGRIWSWQERVQSHNAGLPFSRPPFGRFRMEPPWMVVEGGRQAWKNIILRVGDAELGRNIFAYGTGNAPRIALYEKYPGRPLQLSVERHPFITLARLSSFPFFSTGETSQ